MKTKKQINSDIKETEKEIAVLNKDFKSTVRHEKQLRLLRQCKLYLEFDNTTEETLTKHLNKLEDRLSTFPSLSDFAKENTDCRTMDIKQQKALHQKTFDVKNLKLQIETIKYILNSEK